MRQLSLGCQLASDGKQDRIQHELCLPLSVNLSNGVVLPYYTCLLHVPTLLAVNAEFCQASVTIPAFNTASGNFDSLVQNCGLCFEGAASMHSCCFSSYWTFCTCAQMFPLQCVAYVAATGHWVGSVRKGRATTRVTMGWPTARDSG